MISAPSMMILMQRLIGSWYPLMGADCKQLCRERIKRRRRKAGDAETYTWQVHYHAASAGVRGEWVVNRGTMVGQRWGLGEYDGRVPSMTSVGCCSWTSCQGSRFYWRTSNHIQLLLA